MGYKVTPVFRSTLDLC